MDGRGGAGQVRRPGILTHGVVGDSDGSDRPPGSRRCRIHGMSLVRGGGRDVWPYLSGLVACVYVAKQVYTYLTTKLCSLLTNELMSNL